MLGTAPPHVLPFVTHSDLFVTADSSKRFCTAWPRAPGSADLVLEPTSVLDCFFSPSPSSTLSSSLAGSSESGVQGAIESGAVAVSGLLCEGASEGQLTDCTSLLEAGNEGGSVWGFEAGEDGRAGEEIVGTWQTGSSRGDMARRGMERNLVNVTGTSMQEGAPKLHVEGPSGLLKGVIAGMSNVSATLHPGFMQAFSNAQKMPQVRHVDPLFKVEQSMFAPATSNITRGDVGDKTVKEEVVADDSLEACIMSSKKRDREDSLGEVVQRLVGGGVGGQKVEAGEWLSDWHEFGTGASGVVAEIPPGQLEDLDDIFSGSFPPVGATEFWLGESLPQVQQQVQDHGMRCANVGHGIQQSVGRAQLDLYEAVQAGLLYRGGSNTGAMASAGPNTQLPPTPSLSHSFSAPFTSPLQHPFPTGPLHCYSFGSSPTPTIPFAPEFLDSKVPSLPSASSTLLNTTYAPPLPHFSSHLPFQQLAFPLPSYKHPLPPKPDYPPKVEFGDPKLWQMHAPEGDATPKVMPGCGSRCQLKPEPGWQPLERLSAGHVQVPVPSEQLSMPTEHVQQHHAIMPEYVGRGVRLEELSLAERHLSAVFEAARSGDFGSAQAILARLNQQSSHKGRQQQSPSQRAILLFVEALAKWVAVGLSSRMTCPLQQAVPNNSPHDLISKISAYKSYCEVSPIAQFANFTTNQAILDAIEGEDRVHVIDFELGFGGQWAALMQEIAQRSRGAPELKITTMGEDTVEMRLAKENLVQFAKEVGMKVEINIMAVQKLEGWKAEMVKKGEKEALAVNFGFGLKRLMADFSSMDELLNFFQLIKGWGPKVVTIVDMECEFEGTSSFSDTLQLYSCIFESFEASPKLSPQIVHHIERFVFGPKIFDAVNARCVPNSGDTSLPPWRVLLQKAGFSTFPFSPAAESQAAWLVKNPPNAGFTFHKQHTTLLLGWYNKTLVSASAWV